MFLAPRANLFDLYLIAPLTLAIKEPHGPFLARQLPIHN
jgi:hypothetical protein